MTKKLLKNKLAIVLVLLVSTALVPTQMMAQKKVAYIQFSKTMDATASQTGSATVTGSDAITRMLTATGFTVTVYSCDANGLDLATNVNVDVEIATLAPDLIIMQETWGSTANAIKPTGILAFRKLGALNIPLIYNKSFTFQKGANRTITSTTGTASDVVSSSSLAVQVVPGNEANPIFSGITGTSIPIFFAGATDLGATVASGALATAAVKGLSLVNDLEITTPTPGTATLLAGTSGTIAAGTAISTTSNTNSLLINRFPAGTQLGTDVNDKLGTKDMITFACNYGAIAAGDGKNVTNEFLTLWRNAAYILTAQTVPTTLYTNPALGINDNTLKEASITVSPNPTSGLVTVNGVADVKTITVFNVAGKLILSISNTNSVNLSTQAKGVYFVKVETANGTATKKVVVK
ncbi:T9SS type A sorting domain-containing protein [Flavobacterium pectinovorum]|uniref:T9SS type A sorting domain-containing protein n=1 Tax=Flavobacterium pectinovorum TaxID=29533 RepID=UPI001FAC5961|nr:T9SS type A sorting domain-containing protein [Flavobacterium pectinovorum]MCI9844583.1 T9SS type A sorting domain-containing protein [Flavobacterium pectinovorum]